jgi:glycosyltransferase involved in cell wall biosynthesis
MNSTNLVSIIIPCYNQAKYLSDALQSILDQTYSNWECLIINDGSPDNTAEVAKKWAEKDTRFVYHNKVNSGVSDTRNFAIQKAKGDFIQFLDADDVLAIDKIETSINAVNKYEVEVVCSNYILFKESIINTQSAFSQIEDFEFTFYNLARYWNDGFTVPIHCWFFKASLFNNILFPVGLTAQEDWVVWLRIFQKTPKTYYVSRPLAFYRYNPEGRTKTGGFFDETLQAIRYLKPFLNDDDFQTLYESVIIRFNNKLLYSRNKEKILKQSNTYQTGLLIKKVLKIFRLLPLSKKLFPIILKLKSK